MTAGLSLPPAVGGRRTRRALRLRAFSLIEVMVVVGLIAVILGGFGFALRDSAGSSLVSAQNTLASLIGQARAQAAVNQTEARVFFYNLRPPGGDTEKYLRLCQVFIANPQGSTTSWVPVGSPVYLPRGVYLVPNSTTGLLATGVTWLTNPAPLSTPLGTGTVTNQTAGSAFINGNPVFFVEFKADGTINPAANPYIRLVVTTGGLGTNNLPAFNNANAVRGLLIRPNGAISYVNEATGF